MNRIRKFVAEFFYRCEYCEKNQFLGFIGHVVYFETCRECSLSRHESVVKIYLCRKCVKLPWSLQIVYISSLKAMTNETAQMYNDIFYKVHTKVEHLAVSLI